MIHSKVINAKILTNTKQRQLDAIINAKNTQDVDVRGKRAQVCSLFAQE